jgi:hypothetical protein
MTTPNKIQTTTILQTKEGKVLIPYNDTLFSGYMYDETVKVKIIEPGVTWNGAKIPYDVWQTIVSFMKWSQTTHKAEAHMALFYHPESKQWACWAFPQTGVGMTVKTLPDNPLYAEDRKQFGKGWIMAGSVHHHCESAAFQSGTDKADEEDKEGIHITIGKTSSDEIDTHVRIVWGETMFTNHITAWVDLPADIIGRIPKSMKAAVSKALILSPDPIEFNPVWKERIIVEQKKAWSYTPGPNWKPNPHWYQPNGGGNTNSTSTLINNSQNHGAAPTGINVTSCRLFLKHLCSTEALDYKQLHKMISLDGLQVARLNDELSLVHTRINNAITTSKFNYILCLSILEDMIDEHHQYVLEM